MAKFKLCLKVGLVLFLLLVLCLIPLVRNARYAAREMECYGRLYQLGCMVECYFFEYHYFPDFRDKNGQETWSWRVLLPLSGGIDHPVNLEESYDSPYNQAVLKKYGYDHSQSFSRSLKCAFDRKEWIASPFVALKGKGTVWTEVNNGYQILPEYQKEYERKILIIEKPYPGPGFYKPGDDISPEEVIQLYRQYKGNKIKSPHKGIFFINAGFKRESFDDIKSEEELSARLTIDENKGWWRKPKRI